VKRKEIKEINVSCHAFNISQHRRLSGKKKTIKRVQRYSINRKRECKTCFEKKEP